MKQILPSTVYAASAYDSTQIPRQPPHKWQQDENRTNLRRTQLSWGHYAGFDPWQVVDMQLQGMEQMWLERTGGGDIYCNHQRWRFENFNKIILLFIYFKYFSLLVFTWVFWMSSVIALLPNGYYASHQSVVLPMAIVVISLFMIGLSGWLYWERSFKLYLIHAISGLGVSVVCVSIAHFGLDKDVEIFWFPVVMGLSIFMAAIGFDLLIALYLRLFKYDGSGFNRQTGMVTVARRFRKPFVAPFYEFDITMEYRPGSHGSGGMALWLHHRYTTCEVFLGGKLHPLGLSPEEAMAFWDCLQRYMDTSQPLPDLPVLEQFRHLDPATAQYDAQRGRPPRRWRDTNARAWQRRGQHESMRRNAAYRWQQRPCILRARIDPELSIETYYREQEARGIQATPRADEYDNVHRG
ncbi:hypothetical protein [Pseudomonas abyssi]|jgi:hypothetical protein|nr:hypothetical protein [Pseudomonas abyssi]|tara:strand:- start:88 stop:1314 length:1227 start_codon:yes stop_codon:yes gene_type:complete